jgi:hypothetical protein
LCCLGDTYVAAADYTKKLVEPEENEDLAREVSAL